MQYVDAISIDIWNAGMNSELPCSKVCNCEDRHAITHACSNTLKSSRDAVNSVLLWELIFVERQLPGIYFRRGRLLRNIRK